MNGPRDDDEHDDEGVTPAPAEDDQRGEPGDDWRDDEFDDPAALQADDGDAGDNVFGPRPNAGGEILPGELDPENVAFVLLGMAMALVLVADLVGLF